MALLQGLKRCEDDKWPNVGFEAFGAGNMQYVDSGIDRLYESTCLSLGLAHWNTAVPSDAWQA